MFMREIKKSLRILVEKLQGKGLLEEPGRVWRIILEIYVAETVCTGMSRN
jgi:hypothetical protein